jgi:hypothetical protein
MSGVFGFDADPDPDPGPPVAAAATTAIAAECACPTNMIFGVALDTEAEIIRARWCGRAAFFARGVLLPVEEPAATHGKDELLLKLGAAEEALFGTEPGVEDERRDIADAFLEYHPYHLKRRQAIWMSFGVRMNSRDRRHTTQRGPDSIVGLGGQLAKAWAALARHCKASRTAGGRGELPVRVVEVDTIAAMTELIDEAPLSERLRPGSTRGGIGVFAGVGKE